jgi:hypothetical protein
MTSSRRTLFKLSQISKDLLNNKRRLECSQTSIRSMKMCLQLTNQRELEEFGRRRINYNVACEFSLESKPYLWRTTLDSDIPFVKVEP